MGSRKMDVPIQHAAIQNKARDKCQLRDTTNGMTAGLPQGEALGFAQLARLLDRVRDAAALVRFRGWPAYQLRYRGFLAMVGIVVLEENEKAEVPEVAGLTLIDERG